ncbi:hypothetical protein [Nocardioides sp.]|uniref:hypothetical protein n=1 Tax=Nocardioides sp. TaxID=35761 RepID=UPI003529104C
MVLEPLPGGKPGERRIRPEEWPDPAFVDVGVRGDLSELAQVTFTDVADHADALEDVKFIDAVSQVMNRRMATDPRVVVMGEDVHRLSGGTNGATKGLKDAYPDRVLRHPDLRERLHGPGRRIGARRTVPPRSWSSCTPTSCGP